MPVEVLQTIIVLAFMAVVGLCGAIVVRDRRTQREAARHEPVLRPHSRRQPATACGRPTGRAARASK